MGISNIISILESGNVIDFIASFMVFIGAMITIVLHELGHGYVAKWNGDHTAQLNGRLSFNPVKHFDLYGFLFFLFLGFGWAKPVPVNTNNFRNYRKGMFLVAIAGVCVNLIVAFIAYPLYILSCFIPNEFLMAVFVGLFFGLFYISIILAVFNLLPIFPLDGFRIIEALGRNRFWRKYKSVMYEYGNYIFFAVIIILMFFSYFSYDMFGKQISPISYVADIVAYPISMFWHGVINMIARLF